MAPQNMEHHEGGEPFTVSFYDQELEMRGSAKITMLEEDDQIIYLARDIRFDNTPEQLLESGLIIEPELRLGALTDDKTDDLHWVDADTQEESEIITLIGRAIEEYQM